MHLFSHNSHIHYLWRIFHSESLRIYYYLFYIFQHCNLLPACRIYLGHKEGLWFIYLILIPLKHLCRRGGGGQLLIIGNGAIVRSYNGIYFNVNFYFVICLPSNFKFVISESEYWSSTITYLFILISAAKFDFENPLAGCQARCWIRNSPKFTRLHWHFRPRHIVKGGEVVKVGIVFPILLFFKSSQWKWILKKRWQNMERVAEFEIVPNRDVFVSIFTQGIEEKVDNTLPWWVSCKKKMFSS